MPLKNKKHNSQADWIAAWNYAKQFAETTEGKLKAEKLIDTAISRLPKSKCVYGWSGGKDTLALQLICERAGITDCCLGTIGFQWEYPSFVEYVNKNKPENLVIKDFGVTAEWLNTHPQYVFPTNSKDNYFWYKDCNQRSYFEFAKEYDTNYIVLGHRTIDGNVCRNGVLPKGDIKRILPIYDFSHEDVFLLIAYSGKGLPAQYFYKDGFKQGTHAWVMRSGGDKELKTLWEIDKNILLQHRELIKVKNFLEENKLS